MAFTCDQHCHRRETVPVAIDARRVRSRNRLRLVRLVRIVARDARQCSVTSFEALRLSKSVGRAHELEFIVVTRARRLIEITNVRGERLARSIRENAASEDRNISRQTQAGRLQMALETHFIAPLSG